MDEAIDLQPNTGILYRLMGDALTKQGKTAEATQYYQRAVDVGNKSISTKRTG